MYEWPFDFDFDLGFAGGLEIDEVWAVGGPRDWDWEWVMLEVLG